MSKIYCLQSKKYTENENGTNSRIINRWAMCSALK